MIARDCQSNDHDFKSETTTGDTRPTMAPETRGPDTAPPAALEMIPLYDSMHGTTVLGLVSKIFNLEYDPHHLGAHTRGVGKLRDGRYYIVRYLEPEEGRFILRAFPVSDQEARSEILRLQPHLLRQFFGEDPPFLGGDPNSSPENRVLVWDGRRGGYQGYATLVLNIDSCNGIGRLRDGRYYECETYYEHTENDVGATHHATVLDDNEAKRIVLTEKPILYKELFGDDTPILD